jgi:hypothetical protein
LKKIVETANLFRLQIPKFLGKFLIRFRDIFFFFEIRDMFLTIAGPGGARYYNRCQFTIFIFTSLKGVYLFLGVYLLMKVMISVFYGVY